MFVNVLVRRFIQKISSIQIGEFFIKRVSITVHLITWPWPGRDLAVAWPWRGLAWSGQRARVAKQDCFVDRKMLSVVSVQVVGKWKKNIVH